MADKELKGRAKVMAARVRGLTPTSETKLPAAMHRNNSKRRNEADKKEQEQKEQERNKNNSAKQVGNTNKDVANAKPGDWLIRKNGTKVVLKQADIDWAKKKLANKPAAKPPVPPAPAPAPAQTQTSSVPPVPPPVPEQMPQVPPVDKVTDIAQVTGPGAAKAKTAIRSGKTSKPKNWAADQDSGWVDTHGERHRYDASYDPKGVWLKQHGGDINFKPAAFDLNTFAMSPRAF